MLRDTISLISAIKRREKSAHINLPQLLVILNRNAFTLSQSRRYLLSESSRIDNTEHPFSVNWRNLSNELLASLSEQSFKFITQNCSRWDDQRSSYEQSLLRYQQLHERIAANSKVFSNLSKDQMLKQLTGLSHKQEGLPELDETQIAELTNHLHKIIEYEREEGQYTFKDDWESNQIIDQMLEQLQLRGPESAIISEVTNKSIETKIDDFTSKLKVVRGRLKQIFMFYCRQNAINGLTFQDYTKTINLLDLRLYLKYFKDFKYQNINKYRFRTSTITQLFRNAATNGASLSYDQFWTIHRELFAINENLAMQRNKENDSASLSIFKQRFEEEMSKLHELHEIICAQNNEKLRINPKTEASPLVKSSSLKDSKLTLSTHKSKQNKSRGGLSSRSKSIFGRMNFIQEVRKELLDKQLDQKSSISRSMSVNSKVSINSKLVSIALPKILKISDQQISAQGINKSLKKFANFDYIAQEQKIRDIIGISQGEDEQYMKAYFSKQLKIKQLKNSQELANRQQRRKKVLQTLTKKQHHCRKFNPEEIQPYMRF